MTSLLSDIADKPLCPFQLVFFDTVNRLLKFWFQIVCGIKLSPSPFISKFFVNILEVLEGIICFDFFISLRCGLTFFFFYLRFGLIFSIFFFFFLHFGLAFFFFSLHFGLTFFFFYLRFGLVLSILIFLQIPSK